MNPSIVKTCSQHPTLLENPRFAAVVITMLALAIGERMAFATVATDWPRFRGPNGSGVSSVPGLPIHLGPATNLAWRTAVPPGRSSPIVVGKRVFLTGYSENRRLVWCLDLNSGRRLWERSLDALRSERKSEPNDAASSTPVADEQGVYALFSGFGLVAYNVSGDERWRTELNPFSQPHGMASSPILANGQVIVVADQVRDSFIAAFDKTTGREKWKTSRANFVGGYSTPILIRDEILVAGPAELTAYSAGTGQRQWSVPKMGIMPIGSPVCDGKRIFLNNDAVPPFDALAKELKGDRNGDGKLTPDEFPDPSFKEAVLAIDRVYGNGDGAVDKAEWDGALKLMSTLNALVAVRIDSSPPRELWRTSKKLADAASPLLYQDVLYLVKDGGIMTALDPNTGAVLRQERLTGVQGRIFASPVAADGKVFVLSESGKLAVIKAGHGWDLLTVNDLTEKCYATPALVDGMILVRSKDALWAFHQR